jgi:hypothetical protein
MRPLLLSLATCIVVTGAVWAQTTGGTGNMPQLPVGQTFKQFEFPLWQNGVLKSTLYATEATGITLNRAEATDLKIQVYDNGKVTTTITSPKADLYVNEQKMRTNKTVLIVRADMDASSQECDFDLKTKKYLLRTNVKVVLKHFDLSTTPAKGAMPAPGPISPQPAQTNGSILDSPGAVSDTNSAPAPPANSESK